MLDTGLFYKVNPSNWHQTFPFYFEIRDLSQSAGSDTSIRVYLPFPPRSLTAKDVSTSEAHATIGGVVEETSPTVFYRLTLDGTCGVSANSFALTGSGSDILQTKFRKYVDDVTGRTNPLFRLIGSISDEISGVLGTEGVLPYSGQGSAVGGSNNAIAPEKLGQGVSPPSSASFTERLRLTALRSTTNEESKNASLFSNGFAWTHTLRQLFLVYRREKSLNSNLALFFVDVKSNTEYRCIAKDVQLRRSAESPYMIDYSIELKCWDLQSVGGANVPKAINRFGPDGDLATVNTVTAVAIVTKIANTMRSLARGKDVAGAMVRNSTSAVI